MAVTATDENDRLFNGANQGKYVTVAAPGVNILVPAPAGGIQFTTGTSVATANVSGVAALLLAYKPSLKPEEIRAILVTTAQHLGGGGINPQFGAGLVDPLKALELRFLEKRASEQDSVKALPRFRSIKRQTRSMTISPRSAMPAGPHRDQGASSRCTVVRLARLDRRARRRFQPQHVRQRS
jgi:hypothetical protein